LNVCDEDRYCQRWLASVSAKAASRHRWTHSSQQVKCGVSRAQTRMTRLHQTEHPQIRNRRLKSTRASRIFYGLLFMHVALDLLAMTLPPGLLHRSAPPRRVPVAHSHFCARLAFLWSVLWMIAVQVCMHEARSAAPVQTAATVSMHAQRRPCQSLTSSCAHCQHASCTDRFHVSTATHRLVNKRWRPKRLPGFVGPSARAMYTP